MKQANSPFALQTLVGAGVLLLGSGLAFGALSIPSEVGYAAVGPNFLPWLVAAVLALCGVLIVREALTGGFRELEQEAEGSPAPYWPGFIWVSAGLLANAALYRGYLFGLALLAMALMTLVVFPWLAPAQPVVPLAGVTLCLLAVNLALLAGVARVDVSPAQRSLAGDPSPDA